ncbi:hypothetical protein SBF1_6880001 [Candidatus Desulfosporosinus infrequens]|uniref:Uncharacterized protein n=1 Tax=Candidatus Desulfosporosinus infrequens TaxID=2043169 RepID=A0A2U3LP02_9FIRM|nr:hypothetical protein SBF1_6880001 [Candidatus Desulfosporosinus infrequens]
MLELFSVGPETVLERLSGGAETALGRFSVGSVTVLERLPVCPETMLKLLSVCLETVLGKFWVCSETVLLWRFSLARLAWLYTGVFERPFIMLMPILMRYLIKSEVSPVEFSRIYCQIS